jgi:pimeloyl-ACP methyl ester carboxylesterase
MTSLLFTLACHPATPEQPEPVTPTPESTPDVAAPAPGPRYVVGTLVIPTSPPSSIDWLITYETGEQAGAKLWIPKQNVEGLATSAVTVGDAGEIVMKWETLEIGWTIAADTSSCSFEQAGANVECEVEAISAEEFAEYTARDRPQHPKPPFPYASEPLEIVNPDADGVTLAATLTLPEGAGPHPAVVLVSGSGPQDRDETIFGHKPFWVLADDLTRRGVAVLRYDDRGWGESTGTLDGTSADFASDALAALRQLGVRPDIDAKRVGIIGHSEGAMIATMLAAKHPDEVGFIVMLAGPGVVGHELLALQTELGMRLSETDEAKITADAKLLARMYRVIATKPAAQAHEEIQKMWKAAKGDEPGVDAVLALAANEWMRFFLAYDPRPDLAKVHSPVLALIGTTDIQVDDAQNLPAITAALKKAKNKDVNVLARPGLNHLFQHSETGNPEEYEQLTETFDPETLTLIGDWVVAHTRP